MGTVPEIQGLRGLGVTCDKITKMFKTFTASMTRLLASAQRTGRDGLPGPEQPNKIRCLTML